MQLTPIPFDIIISVESLQSFFFGFLTETHKQNLLSFYLDIEWLRLQVPEEALFKSCDDLFHQYFTSDSSCIDFNRICPNKLDEHILWIQQMISQERVDRNLFSYLQSCVYHHLLSGYYKSFLKSAFYRELLSYLGSTDVTAETFIKFPQTVCALQPSNCDKKLDTDHLIAIALLELHRIRSEQLDPFSLYYHLSVFRDSYQRHTISHSFVNKVLTPLSEQLSSFPYPYQFTHFPNERDSIRFRCAAVPSLLPATADESLLSQWSEKVDALITELMTEAGDIEGFVSFVNKNKLKIAVNCVVEILRDKVFCKEMQIREILQTSELPTEATINETEYYLSELHSRLIVPSSFPSFNYTLLVDHIDRKGVTTCNPMKSRVSGCIFFVLKEPHVDSSIDQLHYHFEGNDQFFCKGYQFSSRFSIFEGPPSIIELSIIQNVCIPYAPNIHILSDAPALPLNESVPDSLICEACHFSLPFGFDFKIIRLNYENVLILFSTYETVSWELNDTPYKTSHSTYLSGLQVPSSEPEQKSESPFVTRQPIIFFVLLSISIPPNVIPSLTPKLRNAFLSNKDLWKLLHKSFPLVQTKEKIKDDLVKLISDSVTSLAASWNSVYQGECEMEPEETTVSDIVTPSEILLKNCSAYSSEPLSIKVMHTVPKETLNPIVEMPMPWSLERLLNSMRKHTLSFLTVSIYLGLNIVALSTDVLKFDALYSLAQHVIHSAKIEYYIISYTTEALFSRELSNVNSPVFVCLHAPVTALSKLEQSHGVVWDLDENRLFLNGTEVKEEYLFPLPSYEVTGTISNMMETTKTRLVAFFQRLMVVRLQGEQVLVSVDLTKLKSLCGSRSEGLVDLVVLLAKKKSFQVLLFEDMEPNVEFVKANKQ